MAQRDKNGETASERVARRFLDGDLYGKRDANCELEIANGGRIYLTLYGTRIAYAVSGVVYILTGFKHSGTKLTKDRQKAVMDLALKRGMTVVRA
jgi:hypothetical protein